MKILLNCQTVFTCLGDQRLALFEKPEKNNERKNATDATRPVIQVTFCGTDVLCQGICFCCSGRSNVFVENELREREQNCTVCVFPFHNETHAAYACKRVQNMHTIHASFQAVRATNKTVKGRVIN